MMSNTNRIEILKAQVNKNLDELIIGNNDNRFPILSHYTSMDGFSKIISNGGGSLVASSPWYMNDPDDGYWLYNEITSSIPLEFKSDSDWKNFYKISREIQNGTDVSEILMKYNKGNYDFASNELSIEFYVWFVLMAHKKKRSTGKDRYGQTYVACFVDTHNLNTAHGAELYHWLVYGDDASGVRLDFDRIKLLKYLRESEKAKDKNTSGIVFGVVKYLSENEIKQWVDVYVKIILQMFRDISNITASSATAVVDDIQRVGKQLDRISILVKNKNYESEREVRLISLNAEHQLNFSDKTVTKIHSISSNKNILSRIRFNFKLDALNSIVVGSKNKIQRYESILRYVQEIGLADVDVSVSPLNYIGK